jgi:hypothetical protein
VNISQLKLRSEKFDDDNNNNNNNNTVKQSRYRPGVVQRVPGS